MSQSWAIGIFLGLLVMGWLVFYYVLLVRAILEMLRLRAHPVLLTFAFVSLVPVPPVVVMGILILIIWRLHKASEFDRSGGSGGRDA